MMMVYYRISRASFSDDDGVTGCPGQAIVMMMVCYRVSRASCSDHDSLLQNLRMSRAGCSDYDRLLQDFLG